MGVAIRRQCDHCGKPYVAKSKRGRFCGPLCRKRNNLGKPPVFRPVVEPVDPSTGVTAETLAALTAVGKLNTPEGQAALVLAGRIDAGLDPLAAINGAVKQLGDTLAGLRREAPAAVDPLDELRRKREARQRQA